MGTGGVPVWLLASTRRSVHPCVGLRVLTWTSYAEQHTPVTMSADSRRHRTCSVQLYRPVSALNLLRRPQQVRTPARTHARTQARVRAQGRVRNKTGHKCR